MLKKQDPEGSRRTTREPRQERSAEALGKIAEAVVTILAQEGLAKLTHRRVARLAGVSLAATTYYHPGKFEMIADATQRLLDDYVRAFIRALTKLEAGIPAVSNLPELLVKLSTNAAGVHGLKTLAWCEIILDCARTDEGHALARRWLEKMDSAWTDLVRAFGVEAPEKIVGPAIDTAMGLLFVCLPLNLQPDQIMDVFSRGMTPAKAWAIASACPVKAEPVERSTARSRETRENILAATVELLIEGQPDGITFRSVAQRAGLTTAAPAYHFAAIEDLLAEAQAQLFVRSRDRYREGLSSRHDNGKGLDPLADLASAMFVREVTEFRALHLATYGIWVDAARNEEFRSRVSKVIMAMIDDWARQLNAIGAPERPDYPVLALAHFIGKTIRALSTGAETIELARARSEFLYVFEGFATRSSPLARTAIA